MRYETTDIKRYTESEAAFREYVVSAIARLDERSQYQATEIAEIKETLKKRSDGNHKSHAYTAMVEALRVVIAAILALLGVKISS